MVKHINYLKSDNFKSKIKNLVDDLNFIFKDSNEQIKQMIGKKTRQRKLSFLDCINYKFNNTKKSDSQKKTINDLKYDNKILCNNSSFFRKEQQIPLQYYKNIYDKIFSIYLNKRKTTGQKIIAIDGTYNNTNINRNGTLETTLNMGYYDISNDIPLELNLKLNSKNKEIKSFINDIENKKINFENSIFVCDRAYYSYELFDMLNDIGSKFIIRIRNNDKNVNNTQKIKKNENDKLKNIRFVNYTFDNITQKTLFNKKTNKNELYNIKQKNHCNIVTNLDCNYSDEEIKNMYVSRWKVEEYFKLVKYNFKFSQLKEHNSKTIETYNKSYIIIQIFSILSKIFELECDKIIKNSNEKYIYKINKTSMIEGLFKLIPNIIYSKLMVDNLFYFFNCYVQINLTVKGASNDRTSKIPFTKWYIKSYHSKYDIQKMFDAFIDRNINDKNINKNDVNNNKNNKKTKINKNLKAKLKNITFEKILLED